MFKMPFRTEIFWNIDTKELGSCYSFNANIGERMEIGMAVGL